MSQNTILNLTTNVGVNPTYYDKNLLEKAKVRMVHARYGQKRPIPLHNGKTVNFRRYDLFTPDVDALTLAEGVTPSGQQLSKTQIEATVKQYGAYVELSDLLEQSDVDLVVTESADLLGEQLGTVVEWITRDAMCATTNVQYAGGKQNRLALTGTETLTVSEIRKAVRTLKKNKARMFMANENGAPRSPHFVCICSPDATYDLQNDTLWQDVSKYSSAEQLYSGEIGRLFGVVFVESTEARIYRQSVQNAVNAAVTAQKSFVLKDTPDAAAAAFLGTAGNKLYSGSTEMTLVSYAADTKTVTVAAAVTLAADDIVYSKDAGALDSTTHAGLDVHATLVFGADAYGVVDIDGRGSVEVIYKEAGSSGSLDPLNQRATVGAKVMAYTAKVLNPLWLVKIEHTVSA